MEIRQDFEGKKGKKENDQKGTIKNEIKEKMEKRK